MKTVIYLKSRKVEILKALKKTTARHPFLQDQSKGKNK